MAVETLACFLPRDRLGAIERGVPLPDRRLGSALFADISGFTKLTERMVEMHGTRRGAEELTVRLNEAYEALIGEVDRFGGSVIGFSGDAITCWFDAGEPDAADALPRAARRAVAAGFAMRARLASTVAADGTALGVKVAIATGAARRFVVGDPSVRHLEVIAGDTVVRMAACERLAAVGEVVADEQTVALTSSEWRPVAGSNDVGAQVLVSEEVHEPPAPWPPVDEAGLSEQDLRRWLLPGVNLTHGEFVTDLRQTVPLFLGFEGIDYDADPEAGRKLDAFVRWIERVLARFQASLLDITIGDKGSYLYANFGAPATHEDDAVRAAAAALELRLPPAELSFIKNARIGISHGTVRAGIVGTVTRRTYTALGDEVNLAARLMQRAAPEEILVSGRVHDKVQDAFGFDVLPGVHVKGKQAAVPVSRLRAARQEGTGTRARPGVPLVGRREERAAVWQSLERIVEGVSDVVVIEGEPGLGKSRLVEELQDRARRLGATCVVGIGDPVGQGTLFHGWRQVFRPLLAPASPPDDEGATVPARVTRLTGDPSDANYAPLLAPVLTERIPENEVTSALTGQVRADRTLALMVDLLNGAAAGAALVIVLEDAHWLDSSSWALLQRVAREVRPLLLAVVTRPVDNAAPELSELVADPATRRIVLEPLAADDVVEVVCQRLGAEELPGEIATLIAEKAEGNPFFSEELASALRDRRVIEVVGGRCRLVATPEELLALDLPDTVQGVITSRIDTLTDSQQLAIKFASVIGRLFRLRTLQEIHPVADYVSVLPDDLGMLDRLDLTKLVSLELEPRYRFKHAITVDVAYNMLLFRQRAQLHRAVANWFERQLAGNLAPHYAALAHHWRRALDAGDPDPEALDSALDYSEKAGELALSNNAHVEATEEFRRVIELLGRAGPSDERDQRELHAQTMLGYSLMNQRGYGDAEVEAAYSRANELTHSSRVSAADAPALYGLFSYYASRGDYEPARQVAAELLELGQELDDPQVRLIGHNAMGVVSVLRGELETARGHAELSYGLADRHQDPTFMLRYGGDFRGYPRAWLSTAECLLGHPERARRILEDALEVTRDHPYTFGFMLTFGITPILVADLEYTLACAEQLTEVAQRYGFALLLLVADIHRGWARSMQGDAAGVELISRSLPVIKAVKLDSFLPMYLGLQAEAQLASGLVAEAADSLGEADGYVAASGGSFYAPELERLRGRVHAVGGDRASAEACWERATEIARRQGALWWQRRVEAEREDPVWQPS